MFQSFYLIPLIIGIVVTVTFLYVRVTRGGLPAMFLKAGASVCFIGTAVAALDYNRWDFQYGLLIILGLLFGMLGDIWLDMKYVYKRHQHIYTYAGIICFIVNHAFFVSAVLTQYTEIKWWYLIINFVVAAIFGGGTIALEKVMKLNYGTYNGILLVYGTYLSWTMFTAINGMIFNGYSRELLVLSIASVLFTLSDLVLSSIYFKKGGDTKVNVVVNHVLYYAAQFMFAMSITL